MVTHGSLRIGFTHGHTIVPPGDGDSLLIAARQMDVDILLWGGTHKFEAYEMEGKFFVNPGSATGAMTTGWWAEEEDPVPSFVLMDVSVPPRVCRRSLHASELEDKQLTPDRSRETCSYCTFTSCGKTSTARRMLRWKRYRSARMAVGCHSIGRCNGSCGTMHLCRRTTRNVMATGSICGMLPKLYQVSRKSSAAEV